MSNTFCWLIFRLVDVVVFVIAGNYKFVGLIYQYFIFINTF